jgi:hypothetical protein
MKKKLLRKAIIWSILILLLFWAWTERFTVAEYIRDVAGIEPPVNPRPEGMSTLEWTEKNYKKEMLLLSKKYDVPYAYLMALTVLECGGEKPAGHRYEPGILKKLEKVKGGRVDRLENIYAKHLSNCNDGCMENLATSWGPFQLMGYKAIPLGVLVDQLRHEDDAADIGVKWIAREYGHFLKKKKFKDAFHYHNTGQRFPLSGKPLTHSPYYVSDGLKYMRYFESRQN